MQTCFSLGRGWFTIFCDHNWKMTWRYLNCEIFGSCVCCRSSMCSYTKGRMIFSGQKSQTSCYSLRKAGDYSQTFFTYLAPLLTSFSLLNVFFHVPRSSHGSFFVSQQISVDLINEALLRQCCRFNVCVSSPQMVVLEASSPV